MRKERMKTIDDVIQKLEYIMESDPRTFSNPECEYGWMFHRVNEAIKMLKEIEKESSSAEPKIIHCKDCIHRELDDHYGYMCGLDTGDPYELGRCADDENWYCADAEKRQE